MSKKRIQVYADEETKRRIELAAAKHNIPVTEYCLVAIRQQLAEDDLLEQVHVKISIRPTPGDDLTADLRGLREEILDHRGGKPIDLDIVDQVREERDNELFGMH